MTNKRWIASLTLAMAVLSGCATVTSGPSQTIHIATEPAEAECSLKNGAGEYTIAKTPGEAEVVRDYSNLIIVCSKNGAGSAMQVLEPRTRGRAYGNILMGGVPALVDAHTGEGYEYEPASLTLQLK